MSKYGLQRGIKGSEARHISTQEFYRNAIAQKANLQENIELLIQFEDAKRGAVEELARQEQKARPEGSDVDLTRPRSNYDHNYNYLKNIGINEL